MGDHTGGLEANPLGGDLLTVWFTRRRWEFSSLPRASDRVGGDEHGQHRCDHGRAGEAGCALDGHRLQWARFRGVTETRLGRLPPGLGLGASSGGPDQAWFTPDFRPQH